jgi:hypothetical protein
MSKSKINVTITANVAAQPRPSLATPNDFALTAAAFFLVFDCTTVESSLTNPKSITYKTRSHS